MQVSYATIRAVDARRIVFPPLVNMFHLLPGQLIALVSMLVILIGATLLLLPWATPPDVHLGLLDAVFTATSAVCVTGLIVKDTAKDFTIFGQLVILFLIQIGGLGYAAMSTLLLLAAGHRFGLRERMMIAEALSALDMAHLLRLVQIVFIMTLCMEGVGAVILAMEFLQDMPLGEALYHGLFHAVSAFNNAGFSTFSTNLIGYELSWTVDLTVAVLIFCGGIGFLVYRDILENVLGERFRFHTHTKLALLVSVLLLVIGTIGFALMEWRNPQSLGGLSVFDRLLPAFFHSLSARSAGFNTLNLNDIGDETLYLLIILMAIGGSPGSTAGGIKTTAFGIVCLAVWSILLRRGDVMIFYRRIPTEIANRAIALVLLAFGTITMMTLTLAWIEAQPFLSLMFEVTSALGTVGFSVGDGGGQSLSALFSPIGKGLIIVCMIVGRFGPLLLGLFAVRSTVPVTYRYPEAKVSIG